MDSDLFGPEPETPEVISEHGQIARGSGLSRKQRHRFHQNGTRRTGPDQAGNPMHHEVILSSTIGHSSRPVGSMFGEPSPVAFRNRNLAGVANRVIFGLDHIAVRVELLSKLGFQFGPHHANLDLLISTRALAGDFLLRQLTLCESKIGQPERFRV